MLDAIDSAADSIVLAIYQVRPGDCLSQWRDRLAAAGARGVAVNIMVDGVGSADARSILDELADTAKVTLRWFNPVSLNRPFSILFRDHRKLLLIDGRVGFIGGFCLLDESDPNFTETPWHDLMLRVTGPCIEDMYAEVERDWLRQGGKAFAVAMAQTGDGPDRCRLTRNHPRGIREIRRSAVAHIRSAQHRAWLVTPYFSPPRRLLRALRRAARRGVDVRLLTAGAAIDHEIVRNASWRFYGRLLRAGVRIFEYQGRMLHMKALLVDDWMSAGSCNLNHWELRWNHDANIEVEKSEVIGALAAQLEADFASSFEITREAYHRRPWWQRVAQWFAGLIESRLLRLAYQRQLFLIRKYPHRP